MARKLIYPKGTPPGRPKGARNKKKNPRVLQAIEVIAAGTATGETPTITDAAKLVGMSRESLSRALRRGDYAARAVERAREILGPVTAIEAARQVRHLIRSKNATVSRDASLDVLKLNGIVTQQQGLAGGGGVVIQLMLAHTPAPLVSAQPVQLEHAPTQPKDGHEDG